MHPKTALINCAGHAVGVVIQDAGGAMTLVKADAALTQLAVRTRGRWGRFDLQKNACGWLMLQIFSNKVKDLRADSTIAKFFIHGQIFHQVYQRLSEAG